MDNEEILRVEDLTKHYISGYFFTRKVIGADNVSFEMRRGEVLSLVGESGSGKTTVARMILRLIKPTMGKIYLCGKDVHLYDKKEFYTRVQAIFQDPFTSFNPRYTNDRVLMDALKFLGENPSGESDSHKEGFRESINLALEKVGLTPDEVLGRYPSELSGGQMQRILIARCLLIGPELLVADEVTSMIDASTR